MAVGVVDQRSREAQLARQDLTDLAARGVGFDARVGDKGSLERRHDGRVETVVGVERPRGKALEQDLRVDQVQEDVARHFSEVCCSCEEASSGKKSQQIRADYTTRKGKAGDAHIPEIIW